MVYKTPFEFIEEIDFEIIPFNLEFYKPARTSRDVLTKRTIYFVKLFYKHQPSVFGIGECSPIFGLSPEREEDLPLSLQNTLTEIQQRGSFNSSEIVLPAVRFAIEMAVLDLQHGGKQILFDAPKELMPINGLVWMNQFDSMLSEAHQKVKDGYRIIKLKIGGIEFEKELQLLLTLRERYNDSITIRLDANGAFLPEEALSKLHQLSEFSIHSIEQPIRAGQWNEMAHLCAHSPIPIALDEELIGIESSDIKNQLLEKIKPQYIILKPTLHGGFSGCEEWISIAEKQNISWWATSALESSVGLNAIAQWLMPKHVTLAQGLGTGSLYVNNLSPAWVVKSGYLMFDSLTNLNNDVAALK